MPNAGLTGFLAGFNDAREANIKLQQDQDAAARAQEARVYEYLLQSRDPEIAAMAMTGLMESARPGAKVKGLRGFMGEVQQSKLFPQLQARMNEMVPAGGQEPHPQGPPAQPGSGAMPANQPVRPGSQPINLGGSAAPYDSEAGDMGSPPPGPDM